MNNIVSALGGSVLGYVVPFLFILTIVVFFHELGHFLVARLSGIRVLTFSLGFGPELFGFNDRHGTRWKVSAIPLGGYVKFFGDEDAASTPDFQRAAGMDEGERKVSFFHQPVGTRAAVVAAGPIANFILAIAILAGIFTFYGRPTPVGSLETESARVDAVQEHSAAAAAGFRKGDLVLAIDGKTVSSFSDMQRLVSSSAGKPLAVEVERDGQRLTLTATPELREVRGEDGAARHIGVLGISRSLDVRYDRVDPLTALRLGVQESWFVADRSLTYLAHVIVGLESPDQLGGPIRIAQVSKQVAAVGFVALMHWVAVLSVSIGLLNLFPVPLLDGGHLMFYAVEFVRGRPLSERAQEFGFRVGLALVAMLMIVATYNDIRGLVPS